MTNVTACLPNYNTSKYIKPCLKYFLKSKFINEIIISDDASEYSDLQNLEEIVRELRKKTDKKIILLKK